MRTFYHPGYYFPLPPEHPFPMDKFRDSHAQLNQEIPEFTSSEAELAPFEALLRVHTSAYLEKIRTGRLTRAESVKLGLPWAASLLDRCRYETAGTMAATRAALEDGCACNLAGGTHHAFADRGAGYCVLNDIVVAVRDLWSDWPNLRVLILDTDAHQGNGTHALLAGEPNAFTYSIHVGRNYPAIKVPGSLDVELPRWVSGDEYLARLRETAERVVDAFDPELIIWISGADCHNADRFGQMCLSDLHMLERDTWIASLARRYEIPLTVLYGGGYNRERSHTARLHTRTIRTVHDMQSGTRTG